MIRAATGSHLLLTAAPAATGNVTAALAATAVPAATDNNQPPETAVAAPPTGPPIAVAVAVIALATGKFPGARVAEVRVRSAARPAGLIEARPGPAPAGVPIA